MMDPQRETLLIVDDVPECITTLVGILGAKYHLTCATNGAAALAAAQLQPPPNLILLDIMMPEMDGYEVCRRLKADWRTRAIPIIFLSARADPGDEEFGLSLGAVDFLHKPCHSAIVLQRTRIHLDLYNQNQALEQKVHQHIQEIEETRLEIVRRLGRAAEYRDNETGMHVIRMSKCCQRLALAAGIPAAQAESLELAAPMHDIGKIGIPDYILLKPGKLNDAEWTVMKSHTLIGAEIIGHHNSALLSLARTVALTHHERWDGTGYPYGLAGEDIPIEGRIAAICDVYDALLSDRPYKKAWSAADTDKFIAAESGRMFDPRLVSLFLELLPEFVQIRNGHLDLPGRIFQLTYISTATHELNEAQLGRVLESSIKHNVSQKLTGMLLYSRGSFMQVLEGDESAVEAAMIRIREDPRHHGICELTRGTIERREFGSWSMGFRCMTDQDTKSWPGYTAFFESGVAGETTPESRGVAIEMLRRFAGGR